MTIEISDRYSATGTPYPDENSCDRCEGMGLYPVQAQSLNEEACKSPTGRILVIGQKESDGTACKDDGFLFVQCPVCEGSRKRSSPSVT